MASCWAHPRACGENGKTFTVAVLVVGSSPRVRGKHPRSGNPPWASRLIPACAGKTRSNSTCGPVTRAHPRVCGENGVPPLRIVWNRGSSPRVRGKPTPEGHYGAPGGLIPARAGKTRSRLPVRLLVAAHPRACGENRVPAGIVAGHPGSSPRVRGKRPFPQLRAGAPGLIPARAGKTPAASPATDPTWAHPRACGENAASSRQSSFVAGSSPRVRGKRGGDDALAAAPGLIPARAGKTPTRPPASSTRAAHPRACGENVRALLVSVSRVGSSPRVRGKQQPARAVGWHHGLIPARAGKTAAVDLFTVVGPAHPRACGENNSHVSSFLASQGSSPRVRGKQGRVDEHRHRRRLIPARAGKTPACPQVGTGLWAHPRACGENWSMTAMTARAPGSSPRVRGKHRARPLHSAGQMAHPRACGENGGHRLVLQGGYGSSPRVRGKLGGDGHGVQGAGLIPARAGKTGRPSSTTSAPWAHPRACGENVFRESCCRESRGSSPRVRGKRPLYSTRRTGCGLIPARAGKTQ